MQSDLSRGGNDRLEVVASSEGIRMTLSTKL